jgi:CHAD domain-containing protein
MKLDLTPLRSDTKKLRKVLRKRSSKLDPEAVHKLRTRIHRFAVGVDALEMCTGKKQPAVRKRLRKIRRAAGKVRDLDVFVSSLASLRHDPGDTCFVRLLLHIGAKRKKKMAKLSSILRKNSSTLRRDVKSVFACLQRYAGKSMTRPDNKAIESINAARVKQFHRAAQPVRLTRNNLHEYRKEIKKLRDMLRTAPFAGPEQITGTLGQTKDAIGSWHDWNELAVFARKRLSGERCKLISAIKKQADAKYAQALGAAERTRKQYLQERNIPAILIQSVLHKNRKSQKR